MKFAFFCHSLVSDWNHGNAHFLRGIAGDLLSRGHRVEIFEPRDSWSRANLLEDAGSDAIDHFARAYSSLVSRFIDEKTNLRDAIAGADVVIVHEWNSHDLVRSIGELRARHPHFLLFFHDTHHRAATAPAEMGAYDLRHFDGVLAYGAVLRDLYLQHGWTRDAWTWHEAADTRVFRPLPRIKPLRDVVWIGNWGDDERTEELNEFLIEPIKTRQLRAAVYGVRYPDHARKALADAGIEYRGYVPNFQVPQLFAESLVTLHIPRRPYVKSLPGIPTIRPFEALACGIPLITAPWNDVENLFTPGADYLVARDGVEMQRHLQALLSDKAMARDLANHGHETILRKHTCAHRVDELLSIIDSMSA